MPFFVDSRQRQYENADGDLPKRVFNLPGGNTLYLGGPQVTASSYDVAVAAGSNVTINQGKWLTSAGQSSVLVSEIADELPSVVIADVAGLTANKADKASMWVSVGDYVTGDESADAYAAIMAAYTATPDGGTLFFPYRGSSAQVTYLTSQTLVFDRHVNIVGAGWSLDESTSWTGVAIRPTTAAAQQGMSEVVRVTKSYVTIQGLVIDGRGYANGAAMLRVAGYSPSARAHGVRVRHMLLIEGQTGLAMGAYSDHVRVDDVKAAGNRDGLAIEQNVYFDYRFVECLFDGNVRSSVFLQANQSVRNTTFLGGHMGFGPYGILQDPATSTNDGFVGLRLIGCPIENVSVQHVKLHAGGDIEWTGYATWGATPSNPMFEIDIVNGGPIRVAPTLEPSTPNANSPYVVRVNTSSSYPIDIESGPLNGFAQKWLNVDASRLPLSTINGIRFAGQETRAVGVPVTHTADDQLITSLRPATRFGFRVSVSVQTSATTTVAIRVQYNNGSVVKTVDMLPATSLPQDDYFYERFVDAQTFSDVIVFARSSVSGAAVVTASIQAA